MDRPYQNWNENDLRNAIWTLSNGMSICGAYQDSELLRHELRIRGSTDEGYHNT
jgi:hypothetical protein